MKNDEISNHKNMIDDIIEYFYNKQKPAAFKKEDVVVEKITSGLTNFLFAITFPDEEKVFVKIFGKISELKLIDRKFENHLIQLNSLSALCPSIIKTDDETYRIEEYLDKVHKPSDDILFNESFLKRVIDVITEFELSFLSIERNKLEKYMTEKTIICFLKNVVSLVREKFNQKQKSPSYITLDIQNKLTRVRYYVDNFEEIFKNLTVGIISLPLILNHCDVHKHNLLFKNDTNKLMLIDYEYACYNFVGFDFINYLIESFFDLEIPDYPFYKMKTDDVSTLFSDESFYKMYLTYVDTLENKIQDIINSDKQDNIYIVSLLSQYDFNKLKEKSYFVRIAAISSLFWFYGASISIELDKLSDESHFDFLSYSLDRVSIYEHAIKLLDIN